MSFLAIHGKSRYPGLNAWTRDGFKIQVKVPKGCLLIQAGQQAEYVTGGYILAGFHEVVVGDNTLKAIQDRKDSGSKRPNWRISSTLFSHIASDAILKPLKPWATEEVNQKYPAIHSGDQVMNELNAIKLSRKTN